MHFVVPRYDLKGCTANRFEDPGDSDDDVTVMKDNNLGSQKVKLGKLLFQHLYCQYQLNKTINFVF